ncbi:MAG: methyltransferase domain-containing protein [Alphaproteobacteria bacterium]|nr:methyltransferase domain-containing protein [Alphaproteobacteria bacterium]
MMTDEALFRGFGLDYHYLHFMEAIASCGSIEGKRVFEIGGCLPREIVIDHYKAAKWIGIDLPEYWKESGDQNPSARVQNNRMPLRDYSSIAEIDHLCLEGDVSRLPPSFNAQFDFVFSTSALEHVSDIRGTLSSAARILKSGGKFYAVAMQLWLSSTGHHLPTILKDGKPFELEAPLIPPWAHLYLSPEELQENLSTRLPGDVVQQIIYFTYLSPHINRAMPDDYERAFMAADFSGRCAVRIYEAPAPQDIQAKLETRYGTRRFDQWGIRLIGEK